METILRKLRAPRVICVVSILWALAALIAGFIFDGRRIQIVGFMCGPLGMPLNFVLLLPFIFIPARWDPNHVFSSLGIATAFLIQWQLIAWFLYRLLRREDRLLHPSNE